MKEMMDKAKEFGNQLYYSIFRHRFDNTGLTKSKIMFSNVLLHIQPVKIHKRSVKFKTTMGMGLITFYLFLILALTGILLMFHYVPSTALGPDGLPDAYSMCITFTAAPSVLQGFPVPME